MVRSAESVFELFPQYIYLNPTSQHDIYYCARQSGFEYEQSKVMRYVVNCKCVIIPENVSGEILAEYLYSEQLSGSKKGYTFPLSSCFGFVGMTYNPEIKNLQTVFLSLIIGIPRKKIKLFRGEKTASSTVLIWHGTKSRAGQQDFIISMQFKIY